MSQRIGFWKDCWIYTKKKERDVMKEIIKVLQDNKSVCSSAFERLFSFKSNEHSIRVGLFYLLCLRIVRVQQHKEVRVYTLVDGWESRLKNAIKDYEVVRPKNLTSKGSTKSYEIRHNTGVQDESS
jgi:hypothetical protein